MTRLNNLLAGVVLTSLVVAGSVVISADTEEYASGSSVEVVEQETAQDYLDSVVTAAEEDGKSVTTTVYEDEETGGSFTVTKVEAVDDSSASVSPEVYNIASSLYFMSIYLCACMLLVIVMSFGMMVVKVRRLE